MARNTKKVKPQLEKKWNFSIWFLFTFCLIVSWVFVIETIAGCQIKGFLSGVLNLDSNLRKRYPAECQTVVSSNFFNIERASRMSKKTRRVVPKTTKGKKISNFIRFATTDSIGVSFKTSSLRDLSCVTLKSVGKCFFDNDRIGKESGFYLLIG